MTSVEETVREAVLTHPSFFQSRFDVLAHVLCSPAGGGYAWKNGEVVYEDRQEFNFGHWNRQARIDEHIAPIFNLKSLTLKQLEHPFIKEQFGDFLEELEECQNVVDNVETAIHDMTQRSLKLIPEGYTFHEQYREFGPSIALICNIPENVSADWLEACEQMKTEAIKHGWVFSL